MPSMRGDPLFLESGRRPSVPSLREGPLCLAWEEAHSAVPYRIPIVSSLRGAPVLNLGGCPLFLVREEASVLSPRRSAVPRLRARVVLDS